MVGTRGAGSSHCGANRGGRRLSSVAWTGCLGAGEIPAIAPTAPDRNLPIMCCSCERLALRNRSEAPAYLSPTTALAADPWPRQIVAPLFG